jgi:DNA-binding NarL/FixJ family response regulator
MKVILVGTVRQRQRLRESLETAPDVVGEFESVTDARDAGIAAEAMLLPAGPPAPSGDDPTGIEPLTAREIDVLEVVSEGLSNKAIAERLGISVETVKFHLASIMGKLGAANRTDAVRRAARAGLVTL